MVIFLDRDGVVTAETKAYITRPEALQILPGALEAIAKLTAAGWRVFLFTNQAGVGRGYLTLETLQEIHTTLLERVRGAGGELAGIYCCPHHPEDGCDCRKPKPGMLLRAAQEHGLDLSQCYGIGDSPRDVAACVAAGAHGLLALTGHTERYDPETFPDPQPEAVFESLEAAADWLLAHRSV